MNKQAPLEAFLKAAHSQRLYRVEAEKELLKIQRIEQYLQAGKWFRKVSSVKTISLKQIYYLRNAQPRTYVQIKYQVVYKLIFKITKIED